jgi:hypothetical protein
MRRLKILLLQSLQQVRFLYETRLTYDLEALTLAVPVIRKFRMTGYSSSSLSAMPLGCQSFGCLQDRIDYDNEQPKESTSPLPACAANLTYVFRTAI